MLFQQDPWSFAPSTFPSWHSFLDQFTYLIAGWRTRDWNMHISMYTHSGYEHRGSFLSILTVYSTVYVYILYIYIFLCVYVYTQTYRHIYTHNRSTSFKHLVWGKSCLTIHVSVGITWRVPTHQRSNCWIERTSQPSWKIQTYTAIDWILIHMTTLK